MCVFNSTPFLFPTLSLLSSLLLLSSHLLPSPFHPPALRIAFTMVSDPEEQEADCEELGTATLDINMVQLLCTPSFSTSSLPLFFFLSFPPPSCMHYFFKWACGMQFLIFLRPLTFESFEVTAVSSADQLFPRMVSSQPISNQSWSGTQ